MPTNRRKRRVERRTDVAALDFSHYWHLTRGRPMFTHAGYRTGEELVAAWRQHEGVILPLWVKHYPGTRPFGWWLAEGRERRVLTVAEVREWVAQHWPGWGSNLDDAGLQRLLTNRKASVAPERFGLLNEHGRPPFQESEADYLRRHGLLTGAEEKALDAGEGHRLFDFDKPDLWKLHLRDLYAKGEE